MTRDLKRGAVIMAAVLCALMAGPGPVGSQNSPGYFLLQRFETISNPKVRDRVNINGTGQNFCTQPLPLGSDLRITYDGKLIAVIPIRALAPGSTQNFNVTVNVPPPLPTPPPNNETTLGFTISLPQGSAAGPDQKTSPCRVQHFPPP